MLLQLLSRRSVVITAFALATVPVLAAPARAQCPSMDSRIEVNRRPVRTEGVSDLMELLTRVVSPSRLVGRTGRPADRPIVIVDGVYVSGGVGALDIIPLTQVQRVTTLRPLDAVTRYGGMAQGGAILIETRVPLLARAQPQLPDCSVKREP